MVLMTITMEAPLLRDPAYLLPEIEHRHGPVLDDFRPGWLERNARDWWTPADTEQAWSEARTELTTRMARTAHGVLCRFPAGYRDATLDQLTPEQHPDEIRRWMADPKAKTLVLAGKPGAGKTHAAYAALHEQVLAAALHSVTQAEAWRSTKVPVAVGTSLASLLDLLRQDSDGAIWEHAKLTPLLLLDDLAAVRVTDWSVERHWLLADARCSNDRKTIITTNAPHTALTEAWGQPAMDRWRDRCVVLTVAGESRRKPVTW
jgi:hypothetical protein